MQSLPIWVKKIWMEKLFVLWIHCIDWEEYVCMMSEMELNHWYGAWREWVDDDWLRLDVSAQCLPF